MGRHGWHKVLFGSFGGIVVVAIALLLSLDNAQTEPASSKSRQDIFVPGEVRPLPGQLDRIPMFNSNSPEWPKTSGILLSTFPPQDKTVPSAHLNYAFNGTFTLFTHHFSHTPRDLRTLYLAVMVQNPGTRPVTLTIPAAASYLMEPDAPFTQKPQIQDNPTGAIFSGPGIRAVDSILRGQRQGDFPAQLSIPPGEYRLLMNHPIPVKGLARPINGRSTFMRLNSTGPVYVADLAMYAPQTADGEERSPTLTEWQKLLNSSGLAGPRDKTPTLPNQGGPLIYSRVAGVQQGSTWTAKLTDPGQDRWTLPMPGQGIAYAISTLRAGRLGTQQSQAAPLLVRYPDTAYEAHGNYGVHYDLTMPFYNAASESQTLSLMLATPLKEEKLSQKGLRFRNPPPTFPFFRGTVRLQYSDEQNRLITRYLHLWHRTGEQVKPLLKLTLKPQSRRTVKLDFLYPPDATPPQIVRVETLLNGSE
jgi:hypothetical protein